MNTQSLSTNSQVIQQPSVKVTEPIKISGIGFSFTNLNQFLTRLVNTRKNRGIVKLQHRQRNTQWSIWSNECGQLYYNILLWRLETGHIYWITFTSTSTSNILLWEGEEFVCEVVITSDKSPGLISTQSVSEDHNLDNCVRGSAELLRGVTGYVVITPICSASLHNQLVQSNFHGGNHNQLSSFLHLLSLHQMIFYQNTRT